ncbi:aspartic peptidase domain-containing protein [Boeremia exigua]|uniref:aspartic peptidase domain-containing protein n=1 Tax=Boeremia exigua TaxID=749465 RepID=UPI001E8D8196|nr:aspartic peptidase domain-containing protein [Boeremia exigua]KAH6629787.1 aspartic peptidase domain-containing protein [Boeremia exigua]
MACPNGSVPLVLPWTNNSVSAAGTVLSRGISFSVGTPPQSFSLTPSTSSNNLFLNSAAECVAATNSSCIGQLGGIYDSATSTSFAEVDYSTWGGSRDTVDLALASSYVFFDDAMSFGLKPTANKFAPFPIYTNGSSDTSADPFMAGEPNSKATLPLGLNSTFLNHLVDSGQASSRTFGLWVGSESEDTPQDGLLVIGGYDESRLKSAATTFPMFSNCLTCAILTAITYDVGGKSTSLFSDATDTLIVNLDPFSSDLKLPSQMLQNLAAAETTAVWNGTSRRFELPAATAPVGTVTITISDTGVPLKDASKPSVATYKTVIPASELYSRPRAYNAAGVLEVDNATVYNMAVTNQTGAITLGTLGLPFFTQNYLVVDPDARNFQLAPAVVAPADPKGADAKVKQVCRILPNTKPKSQVALLAGAIVGAIIGTLLLVGLVWYIRRRKQNTNARHSCGGSEAAITASVNPLCERAPTRTSSENKSLELPLQVPQPVAMSLRDSTILRSSVPNRAMSNRSGRSDNNNGNPRRGLVHDVFRKVDEENDGRLLDERPMGLSETIHSTKTLPRLAAEHEV